MDQGAADRLYRERGGRLAGGETINAFVDLDGKRVVVSRLAEPASAADEAVHVLMAAHRAAKGAGRRGVFTPSELRAVEKRFGSIGTGVGQTAEQRANEQEFAGFVMEELATGMKGVKGGRCGRLCARLGGG